MLLYNAEIFRMTNPGFYQHTDSPHPVSLEQARDIVAAAHPDFPAAWVGNDGGIIAVGDPTYAHAYAVDLGTGHINGLADINGGVMGGWPTCTTAPGRVLVACYALFVVAAGARSAVQLSTHASRAPVAYGLSALAAVVYACGLVLLVRVDRNPKVSRVPA